jgi:acyl-CoA thioester hydrolase
VTANPDGTGQFFDAMVHLRWGDEDSLGHINNVTHLRLLEEARIRFITQLGYTGEADFGMVTVRHEIDYVKPLHYSIEPITIRCWLSRIGTSSFTMRCQTRDQADDVVLEAVTVIVVTILDGSSSTPIPDNARRVLRPFLHATTD